MADSTNTIKLELRQPAHGVAVFDIQGAVTAASESALTDAHNIASAQGAKALLLNFSNLEYMNSSGIGLLVTLLVRANRHGQQLLAYGLNDHYRHIFELTRLTDAIGVHDSEADALAAAGGAR
jgi:anti-sigma B factor antagonist